MTKSKGQESSRERPYRMERLREVEQVLVGREE